MSNPSRARFSGEPVNFTYSSNVMPRANRSGVMSLHEAVELARVLADDLALDRQAHPREVLGDPLLRVGPDPVGVRIVRTPHDVVLADERDHRGHRRLVLVRRVSLAAPELARLHREIELVVAVVVLLVHAVEDVRQPADT